MNRRLKNCIFILLLIGIPTLKFGIEMSNPWHEDHDGAAGAFNSVFARNFLRYGYLETKFGCVRNGGWVENKEFVYYVSHPVTFPLLLSLSFKIFGIHEASARFVPMLFALGSIPVFYFFAKKFFGRTAALFASLFFVFSPIFLSFGNQADPDSMELFFVLLFVWSYFNDVRVDRVMGSCKTVTTWPRLSYGRMNSGSRSASTSTRLSYGRTSGSRSGPASG